MLLRLLQRRVPKHAIVKCYACGTPSSKVCLIHYPSRLSSSSALVANSVLKSSFPVVGAGNIPSIRQIHEASEVLPGPSVVDSENVEVSNSVSTPPLKAFEVSIRGMPKNATEDSLHDYFCQIGDVFYCDIHMDDRKKRVGIVRLYVEAKKGKRLGSQTHVINGAKVAVTCKVVTELKHYVKNLSPSTTTKSLANFYSQFGGLEHAEVTSKKLSRGFVEFLSQEQVDKAIRSLPHTIDGNKVKFTNSTKDFTLFAAGLPPHMSNERLKEYFEKFGPVYKSLVFDGQPTNELGGSGLVVFSSKQGLNHALAASTHTIDSREIEVHTSDQQMGRTPSLFFTAVASVETLLDTLSKYGSVVSLHLARRKGRRNGIVTFASTEEASQALLARPLFVGENEIRIITPHEAAILLSKSKKINDIFKERLNTEPTYPKQPTSETTDAENPAVETMDAEQPAREPKDVKSKGSKFSKLVVDNLPANTTEERIREHFSQFGELLKVQLVQHAGALAAHLVFNKTKAFDEAISSQSHVMNGSRVSVRPSNALKIVVNGLSPSTTKDSLKDCFSRFGDVFYSKIFEKQRKGINGVVNLYLESSKSNELKSKTCGIDGEKLRVTLRAFPDMRRHLIQPAKILKNAKQPDVSQLSKLVVLNLPKDSTEELVREHFSEFGEIFKAELVKRDDALVSRVTFSEKEAFEKAVSSQSHVINGNPVSVCPFNAVKIVVRKLSQSTTKDSLQAYFSRFGDVLGVELHKEGSNKIGVVNLHLKSDNSGELNSQTHEIDGQKVYMERASPSKLVHYLKNHSSSTKVRPTGKPHVANTSQFNDLVVLNLSNDATRELVREHFSQFGHILIVKMVQHAGASASRVIFAEKEAVDKAVSSQSHVINGNPVIVRPSNALKIALKGLSPSTTEDSLKDYFSRFGDVFRCQIDEGEEITGQVGLCLGNNNNDLLKSEMHVIDGQKVNVMRKSLPKLSHYINYLLPSTEVQPTRKSKVAEKPGRQFSELIVDNLPANTTEEMIREHFSQFGDVPKVGLVQHAGAVLSYVAFSEKEAFDKAISSQSHVINGSSVSAHPSNAVRIVVEGLSPSTTEDSLKDYFSRFGDIFFSEIFEKKWSIIGVVNLYLESGKDKELKSEIHDIDDRRVRVYTKSWSFS